MAVNASKVEVLGRMSDLFIPASNFLVSPVIGYVDHIPEFVPEEREVQRIISARVADIVSPEIQKKTILEIGNQIKLDTPYFEVEKEIVLEILLLVDSCLNMSKEKTGAIIVIERSNSLEFVKSTGDKSKIEITPQIIESIFHKNGPLHDGAIIIKGNTITATRIILPVSDSNSIPKRYGLRHRAGIGISEKTDALVIVVSEQRGDITYIKDGNLEKISSSKKLKEFLTSDLSD